MSRYIATFRQFALCTASLLMLLVGVSQALAQSGNVQFQLWNPQNGACLAALPSKIPGSAKCDWANRNTQWYWTAGGLANVATNDCVSNERVESNVYKLEPCPKVSADRTGLARSWKFTLVRAMTPTYCAEVFNGNSDARVGSLPCGTTAGGRWEYRFADANEPFRIVHGQSSKCLTATNDGSGMTLEPCTQGAENFQQIWHYQRSGDKHRLRSLSSGRCVTVSRTGRDQHSNRYAETKFVTTDWPGELDVCGGQNADRQFVVRKNGHIDLGYYLEGRKDDLRPYDPSDSRPFGTEASNNRYACLYWRGDAPTGVRVRGNIRWCDRADAWAHRPISDAYQTTVTLRYVKTIRPAEGIGGAAKYMSNLAVEVALTAFEQLAGAHPVGAVAVGMISPFFDIIKDLNLGEMILKKIDQQFSGTDQLFIKVNGQRLWEGYKDARSGARFNFDKQWNLDKEGFELELFDKDEPFVLSWFSKSAFDDSMGGIKLDSAMELGEFAAVIQGDDDSLYEVAYTITTHIPYFP